ncbi:hypothetical protein NKH99_15115 [Mesorhizobium sp. M0854]|uniref:hypothetical protein n=1 Tax=Mesorhizobium sp. M0854 TaxID=2957013 RepID=UPI003337B460
MTRRGATKAVETAFGEGRLRIARSYLKAARLEVAMSETGDIGNPAMSQIVNAAIAYADALTARFAGTINRADHAAVVKTMRDALGNRLPAAQASRLRSILDEKDEAQYGIRAKSLAEAESLLDKLEKFAEWAEKELEV